MNLGGHGAVCSRASEGGKVDPKRRHCLGECCSQNCRGFMPDDPPAHPPGLMLSSAGLLREEFPMFCPQVGGGHPISFRPNCVVAKLWTPHLQTQATWCPGWWVSCHGHWRGCRVNQKWNGCRCVGTCIHVSMCDHVYVHM